MSTAPPIRLADILQARQPQRALAEAHKAFRRWLGPEYDMDAANATLACAAAERLRGDPLWLLLVSGSGNAKTETAQCLSGVGAVIASTIASEGALLSATAKRERATDATGGLLRQLDPRGILVIKDVTSLLSADRNMRGQVIAALREVHDGQWCRNVGTDGGRTLTWAGRIAVVGAVTTAWDRAHDVIGAMGDRFVVLRMDSTTHRAAAGARAIANTGSETAMRAELANVARLVVEGMNPTPDPITSAETDVILAAADLVTLARTGVDYDYRGDVIDAHAPEMPTRFAKELTQLLLGAVAIGLPRSEALRLAIRCARDSLPPIRLAIIDDLAANPDATVQDVRRRLAKPRSTVDRQLQALHALGVLEVDEVETEFGGRPATRWHYRLAEGINPAALVWDKRSTGSPSPCPDLLVQGRRASSKSEGEPVYGATHISGQGLSTMGDSAPTAPTCSTCGLPMLDDLLGDGRHPTCDDQQVTS